MRENKHFVALWFEDNKLRLQVRGKELKMICHQDCLSKCKRTKLFVVCWICNLINKGIKLGAELRFMFKCRWKSCNSTGLERKWGCSNVRKLEMRNEDK